MENLKLKVPAEFDSAAPEQRIAFVQQLWDRIAENPSDVPVPESHIQLLKQRLKDYEDNPEQGRPWEEVKKELLSKLQGN